MFRPEAADDEETTESPREPPKTEVPERAGLPVDPRRFSLAVRRGWRWLAVISVAVAAMGAAAGKFVIKKTYVAGATVLWEPPQKAGADQARELQTMAQSVKLPVNVRAVRDRVRPKATLESVAGALDVALGDNTALITVVAKADEREESATLANTMVDVFLESQRKVAEGRLADIVASLRQSLSQSEQALSEVRTRYDKFRTDHHVGDLSVEVQGAIAEAARLRVAANDGRIELEGMNAREASLRASIAKSPETLVTSRNQQRPDVARLAQVETDLAAARSRYSEDHPIVLALAAEADSLRKKTATGEGVIVSQTIGRNPLRDNMSSQVEEANALLRSIRERQKIVTKLQRDAEERAAKLSSVEGEAARLLADVSANEGHVASLLKQIAMAEDDVRGASSGFQIVSHATPPDRAERGLGRIVALLAPVLALVLTSVVLILLELRGLRLKSGAELGFWAQAPVLWTTTWPEGGRHEASELSRALADAVETRDAVIGLAPWNDKVAGLELAEAVVARLRQRGDSGAVLDSRTLVAGEETLAEALEHRRVGTQLRLLRASSRVVLFVLPGAGELSAMRAAIRWLDALVVVLPAGVAPAFSISGLRSAVGLAGRGIAWVVVGVPTGLLGEVRAFGEAHWMWRGRARAERSDFYDTRPVAGEPHASEPPPADAGDRPDRRRKRRYRPH